MPRAALLIGIDNYSKVTPLKGCVADAQAMYNVLKTNEDGSANYDCRLVTSTPDTSINLKLFRSLTRDLLEKSKEDALFYFAGHGVSRPFGGFLMSQDGDLDEPGLLMDELLAAINQSKAKSVLVILDCCRSGLLGATTLFQGNNGLEEIAQIREGVTILAASRPTESAVESNGHGIFTRLVIDALSGGATDVRGQVSAASIYAYVEQALGAWDQRPLYKSHADCLAPVRRCRPDVPDALLRELPVLFEQADSMLLLAPSFEYTSPDANQDHVAIFNKLKVFRNARLLVEEQEKDLYFLALDSGWVKLSPLGQLYWRLAKENRIRP
jgi:Caspase domain